MAEAAEVARFVPGDDETQSARGRLAEHEVGQVSRAHLARHLNRFWLPDRRAATGSAAVQQRLVEERQLGGCHDAAGAGAAGLAHRGVVESLEHRLTDLRLDLVGPAHLRPLFLRELLADVYDVGHVFLLANWQNWQADLQGGQPERLSDSLAYELAVVAIRLALDDLGKDPHAAGRVVDEAAAGLPVEPPGGEPLESHPAIVPLALRVGGGGEAGGMGEEVLDQHRLLAILAELGNQVCHRVVDPKLALLDQQPGGRRGDGLRRGVDDVSGFIASGHAGVRAGV